jgi:hypothetical protein
VSGAFIVSIAEITAANIPALLQPKGREGWGIPRLAVLLVMAWSLGVGLGLGTGSEANYQLH